MIKKKIAVLLLSCMTSLPVAVYAAESAKAPNAAVETAQTEVSTVNINTADVDALQSVLVGVGKVKAQAIIDHRTANGPFASVDELLEVKGIGAATLERNRERLSVN
jgi:competence protein ComEA